MNAVMFSAEKATGMTFPAPCTDVNCAKVHRLSKDERLHEDQLYIQILDVLKEFGGGIHIWKRYYPSRQVKERLERVYAIENAKELNTRLAGSSQASPDVEALILDVRKKR